MAKKTRSRFSPRKHMQTNITMHFLTIKVQFLASFQADEATRHGERRSDIPRPGHGPGGCTISSSPRNSTNLELYNQKCDTKCTGNRCWHETFGGRPQNQQSYTVLR